MLRTLGQVFGVENDVESTLSQTRRPSRCPATRRSRSSGRRCWGSQCLGGSRLQASRQSQDDPVELPFIPDERVATVVRAACLLGPWMADTRRYHVEPDVSRARRCGVRGGGHCPGTRRSRPRERSWNPCCDVGCASRASKASWGGEACRDYRTESRPGLRNRSARPGGIHLQPWPNHLRLLIVAAALGHSDDLDPTPGASEILSGGDWLKTG